MSGPELETTREPDDPGLGIGSQGFEALDPASISSWAEGTRDAPPARPTPLPNRPKGRLFVGSVAAATFLFSAYLIWSSFFRYAAYGTVAGRMRVLSAPFDGVVEYVHVREGEHVRQGQMLLTLDNLPLEHQLAERQDALRLSQASLQAEMSKVRWLYDEHFDRAEKAAADYYQAWAELLNQQARLDDLTLKLNRSRELHEHEAITQEQLDEIVYAEQGQRSKVEKSTIALATLKQRWEGQNRTEDDGYSQLKPALAAIESLQAEIIRLREELEQRYVRAPVDGVIVKRLHFSGEQAAAHDPLLWLLEDGSLHVVLYARQGACRDLTAGSLVDVMVESIDEPVRCSVTRTGNQLESPPGHIARYYRRDEKLLPVYLQPQDDRFRRSALRVDDVVKLPRLRFVRAKGER